MLHFIAASGKYDQNAFPFLLNSFLTSNMSIRLQPYACHSVNPSIWFKLKCHSDDAKTHL